MFMSMDELNINAREFIPPTRGTYVRNVVLKPPTKPIKRENGYNVMNMIYETCQIIYFDYECKRINTHIKVHPMKQSSLIDPQPAIHIKIDSNNSYYFYYLDECIWVYCDVEMGRGPLGSDFYHWSIHNPNEIMLGIRGVIEFGFPLKPLF